MHALWRLGDLLTSDDPATRPFSSGESTSVAVILDDVIIFVSKFIFRIRSLFYFKNDIIILG